uniref:Uncharacterized protein n=1 Tax=Oryza sativa subsp. japonica TaxID=39947 RepID=Q8GVI4_ORYSJ|nr:hypothetical protein [Oryza sativa Japonica Group]
MTGHEVEWEDDVFMGGDVGGIDGQKARPAQARPISHRAGTARAVPAHGLRLPPRHGPPAVGPCRAGPKAQVAHRLACGPSCRAGPAVPGRPNVPVERPRHGPVVGPGRHGPDP